MKKLLPLLVLVFLAACGQNSPEQVSKEARQGGRVQAASPSTNAIKGYRANYDIIVSGGAVTVTSKQTSAAQTFTTDKELEFYDQTISFDLDGPAGQLYRMYQAAFNRQPDLSGLGFWIDINKKGMSVSDIASYFISSNEFKQMYGANPEDAAFIDSLYKNILHRAGESSGFNWWVDTLKKGVDRKLVLYGFSDSPENKSNLADAMKNGFAYVKSGGPIPVKMSSYENAKGLNVGAQTLPQLSGKDESITAGWTMGDFFQNGKPALVAFSNVFAGVNGYGSTVAGKAYFFENVNGAWVDRTSQLLKDTTGCISPRKVIVADFNNDGKPDVFVACHGIDGNIPPGYPQGEHPRYLLSQSDGTYKNVDSGFNCYCHGASAVDFDGSGYADVIVASPPILNQPAYLKNNRDGTFTSMPNMLPDSATRKFVWSLEVVDVNHDGKYDLVLLGDEDSGVEVANYQSRIFLNDGSNKFTDAGQVVMMPNKFDPMDIIVKGSKIALLDVNSADNTLYVVTYDYPTMVPTYTKVAPNLDTVWFSLYNGDVVGSFTRNQFTFKF